MAWNSITEFNELYRDEDIARKCIVCYTPQQNGVLKRMNMSLLERARCMLSNLRLNKSFWAEAINTTCYLVNFSPSTTINFKTPIEVWYKKPVEYSMLKVFGCLTYYHINKGKLKPKAKKEFFMGYGDGVERFWVWFPSERKVILSKDVCLYRTFYVAF